MGIFDVPNDRQDRLYHTEVQLVLKTVKILPPGAPQPVAEEGAVTIVVSASGRNKQEVVDQALANLFLALDKQL